jgi:hypothetical protein
VDYFTTHESVAVLGGAVEIFGEAVDSRVLFIVLVTKCSTLSFIYLQIVTHPSLPGEVALAMFFNCCLVHPSVMYRRSVFSTMIPCYPEDLPVAEDYALWLRLFTESEHPIIMANLPSPPVLKLRKHATNVSFRGREAQRTSTRVAVARALSFTSPKVYHLIL